MEKQINYMWEEYELTYNHALEIRDESLTDPAEMRRRIQELKTEIRKLGSVNVNANALCCEKTYGKGDRK